MKPSPALPNVFAALADIDRKIFSHKHHVKEEHFKNASEIGWTIDIMADPATTEIQGYAVYESDAYTRITNIYRLAVVYDWRNMGIGSRMMAQIKEECRGHLLMAVVPRESSAWFTNKHGFVRLSVQNNPNFVMMECKNYAVPKHRPSIGSR